MAYTTTQLIANAYYASGIVSREFETVGGTEQADALRWLNEIIAQKTVDDGMIPYESAYEFTANAGQEVYFIPNLIALDSLTFTLQTVRYSMAYTQRNEYFGSSRVNGINSLPFQWYVERKFKGANLYMYFSPDKDYPIQAHGTFRLASVSLGQDLTTNRATVNMGEATVTGTGNIAAGVLVVNGFDLTGTYANIQALVSYINTGVIPNVTASYLQNQFVLVNTGYGGNIELVTNGLGGAVNNITFYDFNTTDIQKEQTYFGQSLDDFYITYLRYALADRICTEYNEVVPLGVAKELANYQAQIDKKSKLLDLSLQKVSTLQTGNGLSWAWVNLSRGFTVPS